MKKAIFLTSLMILLGFLEGCQNTTKPDYPMQEKTKYGTSTPYSFSESEEYSTQKTERIAVNSGSSTPQSSLSRKKVVETMKFSGDEDWKSVKTVNRKQP